MDAGYFRVIVAPRKEVVGITTGRIAGTNQEGYPHNFRSANKNLAAYFRTIVTPGESVFRKTTECVSAC